MICYQFDHSVFLFLLSAASVTNFIIEVMASLSCVKMDCVSTVDH
jgi:hypothetical protein